MINIKLNDHYQTAMLGTIQINSNNSVYKQIMDVKLNC